jgi:hypothetical protein
MGAPNRRLLNGHIPALLTKLIVADRTAQRIVTTRLGVAPFGEGGLVDSERLRDEGARGCAFTPPPPGVEKGRTGVGDNMIFPAPDQSAHTDSERALQEEESSSQVG